MARGLSDSLRVSEMTQAPIATNCVTRQASDESKRMRCIEDYAALCRIPPSTCVLHGERIVRLVQEQTGADRVLIRAEKSGTDRIIVRAYPYRHVLITAAERSQASVTITLSDGTVRYSTNHPKYSPPLASRTTHTSENPNVQCSSCDSPGHARTQT